MRSRALTAAPPAAGVLELRSARHVLLPAPAAWASDWQCASAPATPPRSPPLPGPWLVMKKVILLACWASEAVPPMDTIAAAARMDNRNFVLMASPHTFVTLSFILAVRPHSAPHITALRAAPLVRFGIGLAFLEAGSEVAAALPFGRPLLL